MSRRKPTDGWRGPSLSSGRHKVLLAVIAMLCGACDFYYYRVPSPDELWHIIPWFDHMVHARYIRPYETAGVPRYTPEGSVPLSGEPDWSAEWIAGRTTTADALKSPITTPQRPGAAVPVIPRSVAAAGDTFYQRFCTVCHGVSGNADGPMSRQMGAPALLSPRARAYSDGYIYSIIRYGRGVMPRYGDKLIMPADRWAVVSHVRKLQSQSPAGPGDATPIPPGPSATGSTSAVPR